MKKSKILIMVGPILILIGIGLIWGAVVPGEYTETFTIPADSGGVDYFYAFESTTVLGLRMKGSYEATGPVVLYVMTPEQYDAYVSGEGISSEQTVTGDTGSFDVSFDTTRGYLVFNHWLITVTSQEVTLDYTIYGTALTFLIGGIAMLAIGTVLVVYGTVLSKKEAAAAPPQQQPPADVMMFDQQKPPGNP